MMVFEHGHQFFNVLFVGRFQFQGDGGHAHVDAVLAAFMGDGKDVGIGAGNKGQELDQFARDVGDDGLEEDLALRLDQALVDDAGHIVDVDVAAADEGCDFLVADAGNLAAHESCDRYGTGPFGNGLAPFQENQDSAGDFRFIDGDDFIDVFLTDIIGQVARCLDGDAIGQSSLAVVGNDLSFFDGFLHGRHVFRLDADDFDLRVDVLSGYGQAGNEAAAANRCDDSIDFGKLFDDFQGNRPLAGNDFRVVEGMDEGIAVFRRQFNGFGCGFIEEIPVEDDIGTVAAGRRNLAQGSVFRHADDGLAAIFAGSQSHALGVVSGRSGDDAFFPFFRGQGSDFVIGPAQFKGACPLEVFQFQINFAASQIADGITVRQASLLGDAL